MKISKVTLSKIDGRLFKFIVISSVTVFILSYLSFIYLEFYSQISYYNWHSLGNPPETATKIVGVTWETVVVETESQKRFACNINNRGKCWEEIHHQTSLGIQKCADVRAENALQVEEACYMLHTSGTISTIYSLNRDGNIYVIEKVRISSTGQILSIIFALLLALLVFIGSIVFFSVKLPAEAKL